MQNLGITLINSLNGKKHMEERMIKIFPHE